MTWTHGFAEAPAGSRAGHRDRGETAREEEWGPERTLGSLVSPLGVRMRVSKGGSELHFEKGTPVQKKLLNKPPTQKKNLKMKITF